eukprot:scaffold109205_cov19-Tisochrysis_lutea.AAC.1
MEMVTPSMGSALLPLKGMEQKLAGRGRNEDSRHVFHIQTHGMHACSSPATVFLTIRLRVYNLGGKLIAVEQMAAEMEIEIPDTEVCPPSSGNACMH